MLLLPADSLDMVIKITHTTVFKKDVFEYLIILIHNSMIYIITQFVIFKVFGFVNLSTPAYNPCLRTKQS